MPDVNFRLDHWHRSDRLTYLRHRAARQKVVLPIACQFSTHRTQQDDGNLKYDQLNNHGWILGGTDRLKWEAQADIDWLLETKTEGE